MDQDTKVTYIVILVLIVALGGFAYFLRSAFVNDVTTGTATLTDAYGTERGAALSKTQTSTTTNPMSTTTNPLPEKISSATITTNKGVIEVAFTANTPITVENFAKLASGGFYDGTRFHRVIRDFMIQGGDPLSKDVANKDRWGTGGPGYTFKDETSSTDQFTQGVLAMANAGPNTNGSQFFIVIAQAGTPWLAGKHTIFGHVTKGMDVVRQIENMQTDGADRPLQDVIIESITIR